MALRVLFDAHHLGMQQTGNETWARNIIRHLPGQLPGAELHFAATSVGRSGLLRLADVHADAVHSVSRSSVARVSVDLPRIARRIRPDVIFTQYQMALTRTPAVVLIHDLSAEHADARSWLPSRSRLRYQASYRTSARWARELLTVSQFTKDAIVDRYGLDSTAVRLAPNAVDPALLTLLAARVCERDPTCVLVVGNVLPRKNLTTVALATRMLLAQGKDVRLVVAGNVPSAGEQVREDIGSLLGERVHFTGYVTAEELARCYQEASVLAFPSLYEGFGIPVLEAMSAGTPVLVSDRTALPEVAGSAAIMLPATDAQAWSRAIDDVLSDERLRSDLTFAGRVRAAEFSWPRSAEVVADSLMAAAD